MSAVRMNVGKGKTTLVDKDVASQFKDTPLWLSHGYAHFRANRSQYVRLHRWIMNAGEGEEVDHINGDRLDNRRENLRIVSHSMNMANRVRRNSNCTSGYRGVCKNRTRCKRIWRAVIVKERAFYRQSFISRHIAALWVDRTLREFWAIPGYLNFPATIPSEHVTEIMSRSMGSWMKVVFSKKSNGLQREMVCRIMSADQPPPPDRWKCHHSDLYFVWEKDVGIKAIPKERILCLEINSIKYVVTRTRLDTPPSAKKTISSARTARQES